MTKYASASGTVSFSFAANNFTSNYSSLHALCHQLNQKLTEETWTGKIVYSPAYDAIEFYNVFDITSKNYIEFGNNVRDIQQLCNDELLVIVTSNTREKIYSVDLVTYTKKIVDETDEFGVIWSIQSFHDGTIAIGHDLELLIFKNWKVQYTLPASNTWAAVLLSNGNVCTASFGKNRDTIVRWDTATRSPIMTYTVNTAQSTHIIETSPGVITIHGASVVVVPINGEEPTILEPVNTKQGEGEIIEVREGVYAKHRACTNNVMIYRGNLLMFTIERSVTSKVCRVKQGVIGWNEGKKFVLYNVDERRILAAYECPHTAWRVINKF